MPWDIGDVEKHKKGLGDKQKEKWVATANSVRAKCIEEGGDEKECDARAIRIANGTVEEASMPEKLTPDMLPKDMQPSGLSEAVTKKEGAESFGASAYLVVEDSEKPSTWHLRVRDAAGKPDHRHMGAAWAALHGGYRGQTYEGPDKTKAITQLKALYSTEDMPVPGAAEMAAESLGHIEQLLTEVKVLLAEQGIDVCVCPECGEQVEHERGTPCAKTKCPECGAMMAPKTEEAALAESFAGVEMVSEGVAEADAQGPLVLKIRPIRPGFGNAKHNHYYPAPMLKRDAHKLVGLKMYESDHKSDKSTRTWVSTTTALLGFDNIGAPILEAVAHDPGFAQRMRNLNTARDADGNSLLGQMECSILGGGKIKRNQVREGRKANVVEALTVMQGLDWVTKAGAGGKALAIAESDKDGDMDEEDREVIEEETPAEEPLQEDAVNETLGAVPVLKALLASGLPQAAQERLAEGAYADEDTLRAAIDAEKAYLEAARPSSGGRPFGMGSASPKTEETDKSLAERESAVLDTYLPGRKRR